MKNVIVFVMLFISFSAFGKPNMFAGYDDFCGLPVLVESTHQDAVAEIRHGQRVILVDPSVMSNWKLSRVFALAHECGHHILGHLSMHEQFSRRHMNATRRQELEADCWAAKELANNGYYSDIKRTIMQNANKGPIMNGPYPSGTERATYIAQCAGIDLGSNPSCLAKMDERCMDSCQYKYGNSYSVCRRKMCNSPRQKRQNLQRCSR